MSRYKDVKPGSNKEQAENKDKESDGKVSDGKGATPTDPRKNDAPARQSASLDPKSGDQKVSDANMKLRASPDSKIDDSSQADSPYLPPVTK